MSLLVLPVVAGASIVLDAQTEATATGQSSLTWSHTVASTADRFLAVGISYDGGLPSSSTVTYAGIPLTLITYVAVLNQASVQLWGLTNPPAGTANVVVSLPSAKDFAAGAVAFSGVDQTVPYGLWYANNGASSPATLGVPTAGGELMLATVAIANGPVATPSSGQTQHWNTGPATVRGAAGTLPGAGGTLSMEWTYGGNNRWAMVGVPLKPVGAPTPGISGRVFEDVNYGGGAGRNWATASANGGSARSAARVELFDGAGAFVTRATTDASGNYSFPGLATGNYLVRVVTDSVSSSRTGWVNTLRAVQTYRTDASTGTAVGVTNYVGGHDPATADAGAAAAGWLLNPSTGVFSGSGAGKAHAFAPVTVGAGGVSGVDFGWNFAVVTNVNNAGQGSLRQAITNANTLGGDAALAQVGLVAAKENGIFMISNGTAASGLRAANNYFSGGVATIAPASAEPPIGQPLVLDARIQPGWTSSPVIRLDGASAGAGANGITLAANSDASTVAGFMLTRFNADGMVLQAGADSVRILGNWIGTAGTGTTGTGNGDDGIEIAGCVAVTIGGAGVADGNVVNNITDDGITITHTAATNHRILGNIIGLDPDGSTGGGTGDVGIALLSSAGGNTIGGPGGARNIISRMIEGIEINSSNNVVRGNYFGTDITGAGDRGMRTSDAVQLLNGASNNQIGGTANGEGNLIAFTKNSRHGVSVQSGSGNSVLGNRTWANAGLGIELGNNGASTNDGAKTGGAANLLMDHPVFTSAVLMGTTLAVSGYVGSAPGQAAFANARVEIFESDLDASGFGEGQTYLDFLTADASGNFSGSIDVSGTGLAPGDRVTGTATDGVNNTSEFGANALVTAGASAISGRVFEDVNYGGGAGRNWATASGNGASARPAARVELFDNAGAFVSSTITDGSGNYSFTGLAAANYTVRVVSSSVTSSRTGYVAGLLPVQSFRTNASTGTAVDVTDYVGGHDPATADAGNAAAGWTLNSSTGVFSGSGSGKAHAFASVTVSAANVTGVDFGWNYDTIANTNDTGQGSLRQFLANANALSNAGLAQAGRNAGIENALFMIQNGTPAPGLRAALNYFVGGIASIAPTSLLPIVTAPLVLDGTTQPGFGGAPVIELNGTSGGVDGLDISGGGTTIAGLIINRFSSNAIYMWTNGGNTIRGNYIGTNAAGTAVLSNGANGVSVDRVGNNVIGGVLAADRNIISGNLGSGISILGAAATNNIVRGNFIGTDASGTAAIGNALQGIRITDASSNTIGGTATGAANRITFNAMNGVAVYLSTGSAAGNAITGNATIGNTGLGIDLGNDGVTANDGAKTGGQPNLLMDSPVFTSASLSGTTLTVAGYVGSAPGQTAFASSTVEVFESDNDASGNGEGLTYLGSLTTSASTGDFSGAIDVSGKGLLVGEKISGTATDPGYNTSEFGGHFTVMTTLSIAGRVFEDVNHGGGAGRNWTTASADGGATRPSARVELFDNLGAFVSSTTTDGSGNYSFPGLSAANYTVRVVSSSVTSSRTGYVAGLLPVQTFRTNASTGTAADVTDFVGGHDPATSDAGNAAAGWTLNTATGVFSGSGSGKAHAFAPVAVGAVNVAGVDFGFNFDTIVNVNNAGQGSLRQAITNANTLTGDAALAQAGLVAAKENAVFMISNGTAAAGLRATNNYFGGGVATIAVSAGGLPWIDSPLVLDATIQPGYVGTPVVQLDGAATTGSDNGIQLRASNSVVRGLIVHSFADEGIEIVGSSGFGDNNVVQHNWVGLNAAGAAAPNRDHGVILAFAAAGNLIGGTGPNQGNVISGNTSSGLSFRDSGTDGNIAQGNRIGVGTDGISPRPNGRDGVEISTAVFGTVVGGVGAGTGNTIAYNRSAGVRVSFDGGTGNAVLGNTLFANDSLGIDLANGGVTANDGAKTVGQPNVLMDHPVFTSASLSGTTLTVSGYVGSAPNQATFANARVEIFESDVDASGFGEGLTYLGFLTTDVSGNFAGSLAVGGLGLAVGDRVTGTATDGSNNTSEFGGNFTVTQPLSVAGRVFEDLNYGGGAGRNWTTASANGGSARPAARVELFDNTGAFVSSTTTDGSGNYSLTGLAAANYTVRVVSSSVTSSRTGYVAGLRPVQTFRTDASTGTAVDVTDFVGGQDPATADAGDAAAGWTLNPTTGVFSGSGSGKAHAFAPVTVGAGSVSGVDFGWNFDTIVNTNDSGQGSLRQFLTNAAALGGEATLTQAGSRSNMGVSEALPPGRESSIFMISDGLAHPGLRAGVASQLTAGVAVIAVPSAMLPALTGVNAAGTVLDGTTQTINVGDTNPGTAGYAGTVGLGPDALPTSGDEASLSGVPKPEVQIQGVNATPYGLRLSADDIVLRGLAIYGFGSGGLDASVLVGDATVVLNNTGCLIEQNVLGASAASFADPGAGSRSGNINVYVRSAQSGIVRRNVFGFVVREHLRVLDGRDWGVSDNEFRRGGLGGSFGGVTLISNASGQLLRNLVAEDAAAAVLAVNATIVAQDNTISGNAGSGIQFFQNSGTPGTGQISQNAIVGNAQAGVRLLGQSGASPASTRVRISRNGFGGNGRNAVDLMPDWSITGITLNDGQLLGDGTAPNGCGLVPTSGNEGLDAPIIDAAWFGGGLVNVAGRACPGSQVEVYLAVADGNGLDANAGTGYGEGVRYLGTAAADGVTGAFSLAGISGLTVGNELSAIAIDGVDNTSEFGANVPVVVAGIAVNPTSGLTTTEAGGAATFTVVLASQPTANVTVGLVSSDLTEGTVSPTSLTFTAANWNVAQTATVTGVDDIITDGNIAYTILTGAAASADPAYSGMNPADVSAINTENDVFNRLIVDTVSDAADGTTTSIAALLADRGLDGRISLREAILATNATPNAPGGADHIEFEIPDALAGGVHTIAALSAFGNITDAVTLDGTTDSDFAGTPVIVVDGALAGSSNSGLLFEQNSDGSEVRGLVVQNFDRWGIVALGAGGNKVDGLTIAGTWLRGNGGDGIGLYQATNILVGGGAAAANVISGNGGTAAGGIDVGGGTSNITIAGNYIGTGAGGVGALGNSRYGVRAMQGPTNVSIGGVAAGAGNVIANTVSGAGVLVASNSTTGVAILGNTIRDNGGLAIDLRDDGVSANDVGDGDNGPNDLQNFPLLTGVTSGGGNTTIIGTLSSTASTTFRIEFFASAAGDPSGHGEGDAYIGATTVATDPSGDATINASLIGVNLPGGQQVSATATVDLGGGDYGSSSELAANRTVTEAPPGITVAPIAVATSEAGSVATFTMVLDAPPTAPVTVGLSSSDATEGTVSPVSVTFTPANWDTTQTVTVTGVDDAIVDGDMAYTIITATAVSTDPVYNNGNPADVAVINTDNDVAGITVNPVAGLTTTEPAGTATFTVVLNTQPTADVSIGLASSDVTEGTVAPATLTFTSANWNAAQTVTVTGVDDALQDGDVAYTIVTAAATSTDPAYNGLSVSDVAVINTDNDVAGITVNPVAGLTTTESGGTATFTVVLNTQPTADVSIGLASSDVTEGTAAPASLTFTPANWNTAQTVTVMGVDDAIVDASIAYAIVVASAVSVDPAYNNLDPSDVSVTNTDNDVAGIAVNPIAGLVTTEAGGTATFTVVLNTQPTADVSIGLASSDVTEGTVAPATLTFTSANWNAAQTVTVTGVDDALQDGDVAYTIVTAAATSTDPVYGGQNAADVLVVNTNDDFAPPIADAARSTLTASPLVVVADGVALSTLTATVLDGAGQPLGGKTVAFATNRGASDAITPPSAVTDANGIAIAQIRSAVAGTATVTGVVTTDSVQIGQRPQIAFTLGVALEVAISADRQKTEPGLPVRYTVALRNAGAAPITNFRVRTTLPPHFRYLAGTALVNGTPGTDPAAGPVMDLPVATLAGFVDGNGDGRPGPGEPGYATLSFQLVPGAGARPDSYDAAVVAVDVCDACAISNTAIATVIVETSELLARSTLLGRVFEDLNRDGRLDADERGVEGAVVALDDGTHVTTDAEGRFSVPDVEAGPRVLKLDAGGLSLPATMTTGATQVVNVSPGLLATVRFGVSFDVDTVRVGRPAVEGLLVTSEQVENAVDIAGNVLQGVLVVNGRSASLRAVDSGLGADGLQEVVRLDGGQLQTPAMFALDVRDSARVDSWVLVLRDTKGDTVRTFRAHGVPPARLSWNGRLADDSTVRGGEVYEYQLAVRWADGTEALGPRRAFGVERHTAISLTMTGDAFATGQAVLTDNARKSLASLARAVRRSPGEEIVIEGHTDSVGAAAENLQLSRQRAEAALDWLVRYERLPRDRFRIEAWGEQRPLATNATEEGRELNRRIEIHGQGSDLQRARLLDVWRGTMSATIAGLDVPVDPAGRFACRVPLGDRDTVEVSLVDRRGATRAAHVPVPELEITEPRGEVRLPFGAESGGVRVEPRAALAASPVALASFDPAQGEPVVARVRLAGRTAVGNRVAVDEQPVFVDSTGGFSAELPLHAGENAFGVVVRDPRGALRVANVVVRALDREADGSPAIAVEREPQLELCLPPRGAVLTTPLLRLVGRTAPGHGIVVNGDTLSVRSDGSFEGEVVLPEGRSTLRAQAFDEAGHRSLVEREMTVRSKRMFLVALADGVVGGGAGGTFVGAAHDGATWTEGRVAYYLKGWVGGRFLVTSAFDSRRVEFRDMFRGLDARASDRLLSNLDPDRLYPVYGDSSAIGRDAPNAGRFYLGVESELMRAAVGEFPVAFDDVELSAFHRTLYGAQLRFARPSAQTGAPSPTSVSLFGASNRHVPVRDELRSTGGSLYYLSHSDVVEGSVQVTLVVRDAATGLVLARLPQQGGADYTVKELEGRLLFARPVPSVWDDGALVSDSRMRGQPVSLEVSYETRGAAGDHAALGLRAKQALSPWLTVGGTWLEDDAGAGAYGVRGADAELRPWRGTKVAGEFATSEGTATRTWTSVDGGLDWALADTTSRLEGRAYKATAELDVGEWLGAPGRATAGGYFKRVESGFASEAMRAERGLDRWGLRTQLDAGRWGRVSARFDRDARNDSTARDSGAVSGANLLGVQWSRDARRAGIAAEFQQRVQEFADAGDRRASTGAARLWWAPLERVRTSIERQQSLAGPEADQTALGLELKLLPSIALDARAADGSLGRSVRGGVTFTAAGRSIYVREEANEIAHQRRRGTLFGVQTPLGPLSRAYTEYQWQRTELTSRRISVMGFEQGWRHASGVTARVSGEHGSGSSTSDGDSRTTVASDVTFRGALPLTGTARGEWRFDGPGGRGRQFLAATDLELRLLVGLSVRAGWRLGETRNAVGGSTPMRFEENRLGLAYRPRSEKVMALARWTRIADRRASSVSDSVSTERALGVIAIEGTVRVTPRLEWSAKGAARVLRDTRGALPTADTHSALWINRMDYRIASPVRLGLEYRTLTQREAGDRLGGWLQELSWDPQPSLRFGAGFNFSRISGDELARDTGDAHGWFVRAQTRY